MKFIAALSLAITCAGAPATQAADAAPGQCVQVYTTAKDTPLRLTLNHELQLKPTQPSPQTDVAIFINPDKRYQTILGIGGAITDASAEVYASLSEAAQQEFMQAYFDQANGLGYSLLRTTIHSSDFSSASYIYIQEGDKTLSTFDIAPDKKHRIPMIKQAISTAGGKLTTIASPWSAPAFMKDNNNMLQGGKLLPQYREAWATYFTKFINAYEREGIPIWGITVQNEPMARQTWESMIYTAEEERDFLRDYLGPIMHQAGLGDKKIIVWDHNRDLISHRADTILSDPQAAKYVWGVGFHWYETWAGGEPMYNNVAEVTRAWPDIKVLLTEATVERFDPTRLQHWPNAERYGDSLVNDFNAGAVGWIDWNILLNDTGGPNHVGNFCFAPIHADSKTRQLIYTPTYYYLGHFAKFIRPGAQRISAVSTRSMLQTTSFLNTDNRLVTVVLNLSDKPVTYRLCIASQETTATIPANAIQTLVYDTQSTTGWKTNFFDDFHTFNPDNWQDQMIWVNNEKQTYVPSNEFGTREVSNGSLKLKVVNLGEKRTSNNFDKHGNRQPDTQFVAGRICSKNRKEFVKGKWTARLKLWGNGKPGMFPAWWILGARNNEPPVQQPDENIPWPLTGSGEIDIFEHHGESGRDRFTTGAIKSLGQDKGDWWTLRTSVPVTLDDYHEYSVEWVGSDLVYRVDGVEVYRNVGEGDNYPEPMFAILNYAKISDATVDGEWVMEVDWVKHESWDERFPFPDPKPPTNLQLTQNGKSVSLQWDASSDTTARYNVYRATRSGDKPQRIAHQLTANRFEDTAPADGHAHYYTISASIGCVESQPSQVAHTTLPHITVPARIEAEDYIAMNGVKSEPCTDTGGGLNLGYFDPGDFIDFNITVPSAGEFTIDYRLASQTGSKGFEVLINDQVIDTQPLTATGGWQTFITQSSPRITLPQGNHTLRLRSLGTEWNINWLELKRQ